MMRIQGSGNEVFGAFFFFCLLLDFGLEGGGVWKVRSSSSFKPLDRRARGVHVGRPYPLELQGRECKVHHSSSQGFGAHAMALVGQSVCVLDEGLSQKHFLFADWTRLTAPSALSHENCSILTITGQELNGPFDD